MLSIGFIIEFMRPEGLLERRFVSKERPEKRRKEGGEENTYVRKEDGKNHIYSNCKTEEVKTRK